MGLRIRVVAEGGDAAGAANVLAADLRRAGIALEADTVDTPDGAKSGTVATIGEWVAKGLLSAATLNALTQIVVAFVQRGAARSVVLERDGDRIEVTGTNARDQRKLVEKWLAERSE